MGLGQAGVLNIYLGLFLGTPGRARSRHDRTVGHDATAHGACHPEKIHGLG